MKALRLSIRIVAVVAFMLSLTEPALLVIALPFLVLTPLTFLRLYRPPANHLGVIFSGGRLHRWVEPDEWVILIERFYTIEPPISLELRRIPVWFADLFTRDLCPISCELEVSYQFNPSLASPQLVYQSLQTGQGEWEALIRRSTQELLSLCLSDLVFAAVIEASGRGRVRRAVSMVLADRMKEWGILIDPQKGIRILDLRPMESVWRAAVNEYVATREGRAAAARAAQLLKTLSEHDGQSADDAVRLGLVANLVQHGQAPQSLLVEQSGDAHSTQFVHVPPFASAQSANGTSPDLLSDLQQLRKRKERNEPDYPQ